MKRFTSGQVVTRSDDPTKRGTFVRYLEGDGLCVVSWESWGRSEVPAKNLRAVRVRKKKQPFRDPGTAN